MDIRTELQAMGLNDELFDAADGDATGIPTRGSQGRLH